MSDFMAKRAPNSISAGAPTQTPLGELSLQRSPDTLAGFKVAYFSANLFTVDSRRVVPAR